ncbi:Sec1-like protein [Elaphomyces granulatus]
MGTSIINIQRDIILNTVRQAGGSDWKVLVVDEESRKLVDNAVKEDDILNLNVTNIEQIEHRRSANHDMDALYFLSPLPHIVDCLIADLERRRYKKAFLVWTSSLEPQQRGKLDRLKTARDQIADFRVLNIDFFPRESRLVTFRDPWSFPVLFHPACSNLIRTHLEDLSRKIVSLCVSLGEYPTIRYYRPRSPTHEASVLCSHLARFVQDEIDEYTKYCRGFPPPSPRPRGVLLIVDRSMDLFSPLLHEFTYQAMAHDLLPIKDGNKVTYKTVVDEGRPNEAVKEMEINENDKIWVEYRHLHMKDVLEKLADDFAKFRAANPQFAEDTDKTTVDTIKDMLAGLSDFQEGKNAYTLHLNMAHECMSYFQKRKLLEISSVEQCLSTGLDEDYKKPKNLAVQLVRLLDDDFIDPSDRMRLIILYLMYRDGLLQGDIRKLLSHAKLPSQHGEVIYNLDLLGVRVEKPLKDTRPAVQPLFPRKPAPPVESQEASLSRFEPNLKIMLEEQIKGTLDSTIFPFTRPLTDADGMVVQEQLSQASLRSAKPTWARTRSSADQPRQRIIVFMAGGATYAESRACYEVAQASSKDVFLATSHMLTPGLFLRQVGDLSADKRRLDIPAERPKPTAPAHLFEVEPQPGGPASGRPQAQLSKPAVPPAAALASMSLNSNPDSRQGTNGPSNREALSTGQGGKSLKKEKEKKKHHFFR